MWFLESDNIWASLDSALDKVSNIRDEHDTFMDRRTT